MRIIRNETNYYGKETGSYADKIVMLCKEVDWYSTTMLVHASMTRATTAAAAEAVSVVAADSTVL